MAPVPLPPSPSRYPQSPFPWHVGVRRPGSAPAAVVATRIGTVPPTVVCRRGPSRYTQLGRHHFHVGLVQFCHELTTFLLSSAFALVGITTFFLSTSISSPLLSTSFSLLLYPPSGYGLCCSDGHTFLIPALVPSAQLTRSPNLDLLRWRLALRPLLFCLERDVLR